jgi:hypothetical protein
MAWWETPFAEVDLRLEFGEHFEGSGCSLHRSGGRTLLASTSAFLGLAGVCKMHLVFLHPGSCREHVRFRTRERCRRWSVKRRCMDGERFTVSTSNLVCHVMILLPDPRHQARLNLCVAIYI